MLSTELLNLFKLISFNYIFGFWNLIFIICLFVLYLSRHKKIDLPKINFKKLSKIEILLLSFIIFIVTVIGIIAFTAPPNTYDSMTYHMSRVVHWIQNRSVNHYPTSTLRQLILPPFAEYSIMHFQILSGNDRFANFIQWFSLIGSIIGASLLSKYFGANRFIQIVTSVIALTIPMGILQGSSSQNDYVLTLWIVCFVNFFLLLRKNPNVLYAIATGIALGLAVLTKSTSYIFSIPFIIWLTISCFKKYKNKFLRHLIIIVLLTLFMNSPHYIRNIRLCGNPLNNAEFNRSHTIKNITLPLFISNISRIFSINFRTFFYDINKIVENRINFIHSLINVDVSDPRITFKNQKYNLLYGSPLHEDYAPNTTHTILILYAIINFLFLKKLRKTPDLLQYLLSLFSGYLLFCAILQWNPWLTRLQLPLFVLWTPFVSIILSGGINITKRNRMIIISILLIIISLPCVFYNLSRRIISKQNIFNTKRNLQYFSTSPGFKASYLLAAKDIFYTSCNKVGLIFNDDAWEYPLFSLFFEYPGKKIRFEHILVKNESSIYSDKNFIPCAIITSNSIEDEKILFNNNIYTRINKYNHLSVYLKE